MANPKSTITRSELVRLSTCNSELLPSVVNDGGVRIQWVGIGWIELGPADGTEPLVVEG